MRLKGIQRYVFVITMVALAMVSGQALGQDKKPKTKQDHDKRLKELQKKEEEQKKEYEQAQQELIERHMENNTGEGVKNRKEIKKRMKQSKKKAKRNNQNKKEFFLVRMLSNRTKKGKKIKK